MDPLLKKLGTVKELKLEKRKTSLRQTGVTNDFPKPESSSGVGESLRGTGSASLLEVVNRSKIR